MANVNMYRFVVDERDASLYRTEVSLWTFDLDSVQRNGGFSLPPASVSHLYT